MKWHFKLLNRARQAQFLNALKIEIQVPKMNALTVQSFRNSERVTSLKNNAFYLSMPTSIAFAETKLSFFPRLFQC